MVYNPSLGFDPADLTATVAGRNVAAALGVNTLGNASSDPYTPQTAAQKAAANAIANEYARQFDLDYALKKKELDNNYQIALRNARTNEEKLQIDREYNQAQIELAKDRLAQDQTQFIISQSGLLPNGQPTLSLQQLQEQNKISEAQLTGTLNGQPTLQAENQAQQYGLSLAGLTGVAPGGGQTLQAQQYGQQNAQNWAGITGYDPSGNPTLANQQFVTGATGYYGGNPTLAREQAAANTALQAAQVGASLQGPANWAKFLQAQYGVANSPASSLVASVPGGLGASAGPNPAPMTLSTLLNGFGVSPQSGSGTGGQQVYAGGSPTFNEAGAGSGGSPWYVTGGTAGQQATTGRSADVGADAMSGGRVTANEGGSGQPSFLQGYAPYSLTGAIGQVANAPRVSNADLGLSEDEAKTLHGYFDNPGSAPSTWWASKSQPERDYLGGINQYWGGDQPTFLNRLRNSQPRQQAAYAA